MFPPNVVINTTQRGEDPGYGVDLLIKSQSVTAMVWDDDGDAFFVLQSGSAFCKIDVGSNGLGPGLEVEVFEQKGMDCQISGHATMKKNNYQVAVTMTFAPNGGADCKERSDTEKPCHPAWHPAASEIAITNAPSTLLVV